MDSSWGRLGLLLSEGGWMGPGATGYNTEQKAQPLISGSYFMNKSFQKRQAGLREKEQGSQMTRVKTHCQKPPVWIPV